MIRKDQSWNVGQKRRRKYFKLQKEIKEETLRMKRRKKDACLYLCLAQGLDTGVQSKEKVLEIKK